MVWAGLLQRPLEVVCRWPYQAHVATRDAQDAPHARTAHFPAATIITTGHGHGPCSVLPAPHVVTFDSLLGAMSGDVKRCLPAHLYGVEHDRLIASGVSGGDAMCLLECAYKEVALSTLSRALIAATG
jgi:hypothetical protein